MMTGGRYTCISLISCMQENVYKNMLNVISIIAVVSVLGVLVVSVTNNMQFNKIKSKILLTITPLLLFFFFFLIEQYIISYIRSRSSSNSFDTKLFFVFI